MAAISVHIQKIKEHIDELEDAIKIGVETRPATIAFHASACGIDLLEAYLHKASKISVGFSIKHDWFKKPKPGQKVLPLAERKLAVNFPSKAEIFKILYEIEERRNKLIYGKPSLADVEIIYKEFLKLKAMLKELLKKEGEEAEWLQ